MLASFFQSLQDIGLFSLIRGSSYAYLVILALHMASLALFGGLVFVTDLRLLGVGLSGYSVAEVVNGLRGLKRAGLALAVLSGIFLFGSQAAQYTDNLWFLAKLVLLALIAVNYLIFRRDVYAHADGARITGKAQLAAGLSMLLWTGVIVTGRGPATIKDIMHSMIDPNGDFVFESVEQIADEHGAYEKVPRTDAEWADVRQHLAVLREAPELVDGRRAARPRDRSRNPQSESQPETVEKAIQADPASLARRAQRLRNAATWATMAVDAKDKDELLKAIDGIDKACENCHLHYWYPNDKRAQQAAVEDHISDADTGEAPKK
jgi:cytochrome c556